MKPPLLPKTSLLGRLGLIVTSIAAVVAGFAIASLLFTILVVAGLATPDLKVEIEAWAAA